MSEKNRNGGSSSGSGASRNKDELALHVLHSLDQPICLVDSDDCFIFVNKAYAALNGLRFETMRGMSVREVTGDSFYDKRLKVLLSRARQEGSSEFRGWVEFSKVGKRYLESEIRLYDYPGLEDSKCLIMQLRDITDREELDQQRRKSLSFQEDLVRSIPAMIWICGSDGNPYFYNDSWLNFTGATLVEQVRDGWMSQVHEEDREMVSDRIQYALQNREQVHIEFRLRYLMGGHRWIRLHGGPAGSLAGHDGDFLVSALDIEDSKVRELQMKATLQDERRLREQALLQKTAADRANREKSAYLSLASHEIRTPMNPVIGFADLLASNPDLDGDSKEMAEMILKAGKNLLTLLDEVLDYAKIEAGVLKLSPEPLDLHDLLIEIDNLYVFDAKSRGIELSVNDKVSGNDELYQDRLRLQQVLGTLISNAIKMTHTGKVEVEAETMNVRGSDLKMLKFTVRDTGVGIAKEELDKLFQPFAHAETEFTDKYSGTGLGLAISEKLISAMQGTLNVESEVGTGTTVELVIPFEEVPDHLKKISEKTDKPEKSDDDQDKADIIIVDDEESSRMVNVSLMRFLGYTCDVAANGEELLEKLKERTYEMILMDIMMPGIDGLEATRRIRNGDCGEGNREAYIVAISACALEEDRERGLKAGINTYLTKPVGIEALRDAVNRYQTLGRPV